MTDHRLSRRRLLALAGATVTAGCGQSGSTVNSTRFARNDRRAKSVATTTASGTAGEDSSVEINIETETDTEQVQRRTRTAEESEEPQTPEPTPTGADRLESARQYLNESIRAYTDIEGVRSVGDVGASTTAFDPKAVRKKLSKATEALDEAKQSPDVDEQAIETLRTARKAIDNLVTCQVAVIDAYEQLDETIVNLFDEEFSTARSTLSRLELKGSQASDTLESFTRETAAADFEPVDGISSGAYSSKTNQFSTEITGFEEVHDPLSRFSDGLETFVDGVDEYVGKNYRTAERDLLTSLNGFEISSTNFIGVEKPNSYGDEINDVKRAANALRRGTDDLIKSCQAGKNHNSGDRKSDLRGALGSFSRSGKVKTLPSYEELSDER